MFPLPIRDNSSFFRPILQTDSLFFSLCRLLLFLLITSFVFLFSSFISWTFVQFVYSLHSRPIRSRTYVFLVPFYYCPLDYLAQMFTYVLAFTFALTLPTVHVIYTYIRLIPGFSIIIVVPLIISMSFISDLDDDNATRPISNPESPQRIGYIVRTAQREYDLRV